MLKKQIIIFTVGFLLIIGGGVFVYFIFFTGGGIDVPPVTSTPVTPDLPIGVERPNMDISNVQTDFISLKKLSDNSVFYFWITQGETYYISTDGTIWSAKEGADNQLSQQIVNALRFADISPDKSLVLVSFGDPFAQQWALFDVIDRAWRPLPETVLEASWGNNDRELIAVVSDGTKRNLVSMNISKNPPETSIIFRGFQLNDVTFTLIKPQILLLSERSSSKFPGRVWQLNTKTLILSSVFEPDYNSSVLFNKNHDTLFRSSDGGLSVYSTSFTARTSVKLTTFPSKCDFIKSDELICFVPKAQVPLDSYNMKEFFTIDDVYGLSLSDDSAWIRFVSGSNIPEIDVKNVQVENERDVYFINRYDNWLYRMQLKTTSESPTENSTSLEF